MSGFLVVTRRSGDGVKIGDTFLIVREISKGQVRLSFHGPKETKINRLTRDQVEKIQRENFPATYEHVPEKDAYNK